MERVIAKFAVYYRDYPKALELAVYTDANMSLAKDGLKVTAGHKCPRLSIFVYEYKSYLDEIRLKKLLELLDHLVKNGQVVDYSASLRIKLSK